MTTILNEVEVRVLGCLVEKQITLPDYYPLSLNALTNACNLRCTGCWIETKQRFQTLSLDDVARRIAATDPCGDALGLMASHARTVLQAERR